MQRIRCLCAIDSCPPPFCIIAALYTDILQYSNQFSNDDNIRINDDNIRINDDNIRINDDDISINDDNISINNDNISACRYSYINNNNNDNNNKVK